MEKKPKDGYWTVYKLPQAENYVGMTGCLKERMEKQKYTNKRDSSNPVILGTFDIKAEAKEIEAYFHSLGYPGKKTIGNRKTDYTKIDYKASRIKAVANTDYEAQAKKHWIPIIQYYLDTGEDIREWDSSKEASKITGISRSSISNCLKNRTKSAGKDNKGRKYGWKYK